MIKRLNINTNKIKESTKLLLISDIHKILKKGDKHLSQIKKELSDEFNSIDGIIIAGDTIDSPKFLTNKEFIEDLLETLKEFTQGKPTYIAMGNHDITLKEEDIVYFRNILNSLNNINCLENSETREINGIRIGVLNLSAKYYKIARGSVKGFLEEFDNNYDKNKFNKKEFNILVCHDPVSIIKASKEQKHCVQPNTDLVVSGHMHNGLVPRPFHKITNNVGLVGPYRTVFPRYANGNLKVGDTTFLILGQVNMGTGIKVLNKIYKPEATVLTIKKTKE